MDHPVAYWSGQVLECEPMLYVASNAYYTRAEAELPDDCHVWQPAEPLGEHWDFEDDQEVRRRADDVSHWLLLRRESKRLDVVHSLGLVWHDPRP
jgi:hypothetical protein